MSNEDFDLNGLARYLHLNPTQVQRMADRGQLPGRKIAGEWKFSTAEIHHWLEDRIGASDEEQLVAMEGALEQHHGDVASLAEMMPLAGIEPTLNARTRSAVIDEMVRLGTETGYLWDGPRMVEAVRARENLHPTALDNGVAMLHPRRPMANCLAEPFIALAKIPNGVYFGGRQGSLTDVFFLICSVNDAGHLQTLARLSRLLGVEDFLQQLRLADDAPAMLELVRNYEQKLT